MGSPHSNEPIEVAPEIIQLGHEPQTTNTRAVVITAAGIGLLVVVAMIVSWAILSLWHTPADPSDQGPQLAAPPLQEPPLNPYQAKALERLRADEQAQLSSYQWLDRDRSKARIPIERALEIVADQGLPHWQPARDEEN